MIGIYVIFGLLAVIFLIAIIRDENKKSKEIVKQRENEISQSMEERALEEERLQQRLVDLEKARVAVLERYIAKYGEPILSTVVVGVFYRGDKAIEVAESIVIGDVLTLKRDKRNQYDENAIKVSFDMVHIGYLPAEVAFDFAGTLDSGTKTIAVATRVPVDSMEDNSNERIELSIFTNRTESESKKPKRRIEHEIHKPIDSEFLQPDLKNADNASPLYNRKVVITGLFESLTREELAKKVKEMGADINGSISKKTEFVIVGRNPGPSKMSKIEELNDSGLNIVVLSEKDFLKVVDLYESGQAVV